MFGWFRHQYILQKDLENARRDVEDLKERVHHWRSEYDLEHRKNEVLMRQLKDAQKHLAFVTQQITLDASKTRETVTARRSDPLQQPPEPWNTY